jgi:DtxR family Mn-dependent transcriptional regulator
MEDYLEAIFHIISKKQAARAKDIAKRLKVNNSSVTGALRTLAEKGFINYAPYDLITLTSRGTALAGEIIRKHEALRDLFVKVLYVESIEAEEAACKMEHAVSPMILDRLIRFMEFMESCPRSGENWIKEFWGNCETACKNDKPYQNCEACISRCLADFKIKKKLLENKSKETVLKKLTPGQKGKILKIKGDGEISKQTAAMGLMPGSLIEVENIPPTGESMDVKVRGYHITLKNEDAARITVELYDSEVKSEKSEKREARSEK